MRIEMTLGISKGVPRSVPVSISVPSVVPVTLLWKIPLRELPTSLTVDVSVGGEDLGVGQDAGVAGFFH